MRAADIDRDAIAERLRQAATEGRLATHELEQRLEVALSARTYSELDALVADLPGPGSRLGRPRSSHRVAHGLRSAQPALALAAAIPVALVVTAAVVLTVAGVLAGWWLWLLAGWWFFGHGRRGYYGGGRGRGMRACGGSHRSRTRAHASRGRWA
jgi:hypothetical protein